MDKENNQSDTPFVLTLPTGQAYTVQDIEDTLLAVADRQLLDGADIYKLQNSRWQAILIETGKILFPRGSLKRADKKDNAYDSSVVSIVADIYIYLSNKYGKFTNLYAFGQFANIPYETMKDWTESETLNPVTVHTKQKISKGMESAIINKLFDSSNVTGQAMLANNLLGWNTTRSSTETTVRHESIATLETDFVNLGLHNVSAGVETAKNDD